MFEGIKNKNGRRITGSLTKEEKKRRVVLKRVNLDGSVLRSNFLKAGTMARVGRYLLWHDAVSATSQQRGILKYQLCRSTCRLFEDTIYDTRNDRGLQVPAHPVGSQETCTRPCKVFSESDIVPELHRELGRHRNCRGYVCSRIMRDPLARQCMAE